MLTRRSSLLSGCSASEDMLRTQTLPQLRKKTFTEERARTKEAEDVGLHSTVSPYLKSKLLARRRIRLQKELNSSPGSMSPDSTLVSQSAMPSRLWFPWQQKTPRYCTIESQRTSEELRKLFLYALRMVRVVVHMHLSIRSDRQEERRKEMTLEEMHYYLMDDQQFTSDTLTLHYNKAEFAASNQVFMPKWARNLMQLCPTQRPRSEVKKLAMLLGNLKAFKHTFSSSAQEEFCRNCIYARYEKQRIIVRRGHPGQFFYIIFSGSVFVNIQDKDNEGRAFTRTQCVMEQGALFGEISLFYDMPRSATVACREHTECVMVNREVLRQICPDNMQREATIKLDTIRHCLTFKEWPDEVIYQLCKHSKVEEYGYNKLVERNTHTSEFIYIIAAGRVEVLMALEPRYPSSGGNHLEGSDDLPNYLPGMRHPDPSVTHHSSVAKDNSHPPYTYIKVDTLLSQDICDLGSFLKDGDKRGLVLVSFGATVMRVPKQQLAMAPLSCWRALLTGARNSKSYPPDAILNRIFLEHNQWKLFKQLTVADTLDRQSGCLYAVKAATKKGSSGAAAFPGIQRLKIMPPTEAECLFCNKVVQLSHKEEVDSRHFLPRLT